MSGSPDYTLYHKLSCTISIDLFKRKILLTTDLSIRHWITYSNEKTFRKFAKLHKFRRFVRIFFSFLLFEYIDEIGNVVSLEVDPSNEKWISWNNNHFYNMKADDIWMNAIENEYFRVKSELKSEWLWKLIVRYLIEMKRTDTI